MGEMYRVDHLASIVRELYRRVSELEALFPGRRFTLDGHLVGSIGEALASELYGLELLAASTDTHDAIAPDGRRVQVKATQVERIALYNEPEQLLVLRLNRDGSVDEVYNGPGGLAWEQCGRVQKNGQRAISVQKLRRIMQDVGHDNRIPRRS